MSVSEYLALLGVAVVLAVTPGPDTMLTLRYALRHRRSGLLAALGTTVGVFAWAALVAVGLAAFLQDSPAAFQGLRVLGGAYLFYLGYRAVADRTPATAAAVPAGARPARVPVTAGAPGPAAAGPVRPATPVPGRPAAPGGVPHRAGRSAFGAGVACCLTNPKTGLFFLALLPQFTPPGADALFVVVVMGGTVAAAIGAYLLVVALAAHTASAWLNRPAVTRGLEIASGTVFVVLGLVTVLPVLGQLL